MIITLTNFKSSVGKTTSAVHLGAALQERGHVVGLYDMDDEQNDLSEYAAEVGLPCDKPLPFNLAHVVEHNGCAFSLIEVPPREHPAVAAALEIADFAVIPCPAQYLMLRGIGRLSDVLHSAKAANPKLETRVLITRYVSRQKATLEQVRGNDRFTCCDTIINESRWIEDGPALGKTVFELSARCKASAQYRAWAREVESWR